MRRFWVCLLALMFMGVWTLTGYGQSLPDLQTENGMEKPPDFGVLDRNGFFSRNAGALKRISDLIRKLEEERGFHVYLVVEPVLVSSTAPELATQLQKSWVPEGNGLVVVFESDNRSLGFGSDFGRDLDYSSASIPTHEMSAIFVRVRDSMDGSLAPEAYIDSLMDNLISEINGYFTKRFAPPPAGRSLRFGLLSIGVLAFLFLLAIGVGALVRLPSMSGMRRYTFPDVEAPERLGAPCGGGNVSVRKFRNPTGS